MENIVMLIPDIELEKDNPLYNGVMVAVETVARMLADKIDEYGSLDERFGNALKAFQIQFDAYFHEELKRTIEWGKNCKKT